MLVFPNNPNCPILADISELAPTESSSPVVPVIVVGLFMVTAEEEKEDTFTHAEPEYTQVSLFPLVDS